MQKESPSLPKALLTVPEVCAMTGYSRAFVYNLLNRGVLPGIRVGRTCRIPRAWLEKWIASQVSQWENARAEVDAIEYGIRKG